MTLNDIFNSSIWKLLCSLKLAIVLASAATLLTIGGSVLMPANPHIFGSLDSMTLSHWIGRVGRQALTKSWWIPVAGGLVVLLAVNALCCIIDWLAHLRARWRKTGEALIHIGFVAMLIAFVWGNQSGWRSENIGILVGQSKPLPALGVTLKLEEFEPIIGATGRPMDMRNTLTLYRGEQLIKQAETRANHPLLWGGLVVVPTSYGQTVHQGRLHPYSILTINYDPGAQLAFAGGIAMGCGVILTLFSFYRKRARGDRPDIQ